MSDEGNPVTQTMDAYAAAVNAKDVDAFVRIYDDNIHVFDTWAQWEYLGIKAWREMAERWFGSLGDERVEVEFTDVRSVVGNELPFGYAAVTFAAISAEGKHLRAMTNQLTVGLEKRDGVWSVVHEHTSLPIDMESGAALFSR
jgi:ketosteroid isomerase-like protein